MSASGNVNADGSFTLYREGRKVWRGPISQLAAQLSEQVAPSRPARRQKPKSRSARWAEAAEAAISALEDLQSMQEEFKEWQSNLPENLQQSALGEKLGVVCDLDIEGALETVQEADGADLPLGFGRD